MLGPRSEMTARDWETARERASASVSGAAMMVSRGWEAREAGILEGVRARAMVRWERERRWWRRQRPEGPVPPRTRMDLGGVEVGGCSVVVVAMAIGKGCQYWCWSFGREDESC